MPGKRKYSKRRASTSEWEVDSDDYQSPRSPTPPPSQKRGKKNASTYSPAPSTSKRPYMASPKSTPRKQVYKQKKITNSATKKQTKGRPNNYRHIPSWLRGHDEVEENKAPGFRSQNWTDEEIVEIYTAGKAYRPFIVNEFVKMDRSERDRMCLTAFKHVTAAVNAVGHNGRSIFEVYEKQKKYKCQVKRKNSLINIPREKSGAAGGEKPALSLAEQTCLDFHGKELCGTSLGTVRKELDEPTVSEAKRVDDYRRRRSDADKERAVTIKQKKEAAAKLRERHNRSRHYQEDEGHTSSDEEKEYDESSGVEEAGEDHAGTSVHRKKRFDRSTMVSKRKNSESDSESDDNSHCPSVDNQSPSSAKKSNKRPPTYKPRHHTQQNETPEPEWKRKYAMKYYRSTANQKEEKRLTPRCLSLDSNEDIMLPDVECQSACNNSQELDQGGQSMAQTKNTVRREAGHLEPSFPANYPNGEDNQRPLLADILEEQSGLLKTLIDNRREKERLEERATIAEEGRRKLEEKMENEIRHAVQEEQKKQNECSEMREEAVQMRINMAVLRKEEQLVCSFRKELQMHLNEAKAEYEADLLEEKEAMAELVQQTQQKYEERASKKIETARQMHERESDKQRWEFQNTIKQIKSERDVLRECLDVTERQVFTLKNNSTINEIRDVVMSLKDKLEGRESAESTPPAPTSPTEQMGREREKSSKTAESTPPAPTSPTRNSAESTPTETETTIFRSSLNIPLMSVGVTSPKIRLINVRQGAESSYDRAVMESILNDRDLSEQNDSSDTDHNMDHSSGGDETESSINNSPSIIARRKYILPLMGVTDEINSSQEIPQTPEKRPIGRRVRPLQSHCRRHSTETDQTIDLTRDGQRISHSKANALTRELEGQKSRNRMNNNNPSIRPQTIDITMGHERISDSKGNALPSELEGPNPSIPPKTIESDDPIPNDTSPNDRLFMDRSMNTSQLFNNRPGTKDTASSPMPHNRVLMDRSMNTSQLFTGHGTNDTGSSPMPGNYHELTELLPAVKINEPSSVDYHWE